MTDDHAAGADGMRASDADRERTARRLQEAHAEGRLTLEEMSERLDRASSARTLGELTPLTSDLPAPVRPVATPPPAPWAAAEPATSDSAGAGVAGTPVPDGGSRTTRQVWMGYAGVVAVCLLVWGVTSISAGQLLYFWPVWVIAFALIGPLSRTFWGDRR